MTTHTTSTGTSAQMAQENAVDEAVPLSAFVGLGTQLSSALKEAFSRPVATEAPARVPDLESAAHLGAGVGRQFGHNPHAAAASMGLTVNVVPAAWLQRRDRPDIEVRGRIYRPIRVIEIADTLSHAERCYTLAHELGHHQLGIDATEGECDGFADGFLEGAPGAS